MKWIFHNKQWIFSGIGVALIIVGIELFSNSEKVAYNIEVNNTYETQNAISSQENGTSSREPAISDSISLQLQDGINVSVEVSLISNVIDAPLVVTSSGTREQAEKTLFPVIRAKLIQHIEKYDFIELKNNRDKVETELLNILNTHSNKYGIGIVSVAIGPVLKVQTE